MASHGLSCEASFTKLLFLEAEQDSTTGTMAFNARLSCTTSRGQIRAVATLEIKRSKSPIFLISNTNSSAASPWWVK